MNALQILIVEDDPIQSKIVENRLKQCGVLNVDTAKDGRQALAALHKNTYDLMLIDVLMDGMDGIALINELHYSAISVPFYITSSISVESLAFIKEMACQFDLRILGTLPKPITLKVLQPLLQKLLPEAQKQGNDSNKKLKPEEILSKLNNEKIEARYSIVNNIKTREIESVSIQYYSDQSDQLFSCSDVDFNQPVGAEETKSQKVVFERLSDLAINSIREGLKVDSLPVISINVSIAQLHSTEFFDMINNYFKDRNIQPNKVILEVNEYELDLGFKAILPGITRARIHGYTAAIGHIKKGYQSLLMIRELPISEIRLDQSIIDNCHRIMGKKVLISSLIGMAKIESIKSTAVGVNSADELNTLRHLSCDCYQLSPA